MKCKLSFNSLSDNNWIFRITLLFALFASLNVKAQFQQVQTAQPNNSSFVEGQQLTRAQFNALSDPDQRAFLMLHSFEIVDLKNITADDIDNLGPNEQLIFAEDFYKAVLEKKMDILHKPDMYKVIYR